MNDSHPLHEDDPEPRLLPETPGTLSDAFRTGLSALFPPAVPVAPEDLRGACWKPVLVLDLQEGKGLRGDGEPVIRSMVRFLRQDGQEGRLKEWTAGDVTVPPDDWDAPWIPLARKEGMGLDAFFLARDAWPGLPEPRIRDRRGEEVKVLPPGRVHLSFRPELPPWGGSEYRFAVDAALVCSGESAGLTGRVRGLKDLYLLTGTGICPMPGRGALAEVLDFLEERSWRLDPREARSFGSALEKTPVEGLAADPVPLQVEQRSCRGSPVLRLEADQGIWGRGPAAMILRVEIDWDLAEEPDAGWLRVMEASTGGQAACLAIRDLAWEERVIRWFRNLAVPDLDVPEEAEPWVPGRYRAVADPGPGARLKALDEMRGVRLGCSVETFLADWGVRLMEEGFHIALGRQAPLSSRGSVGIHVDRGMDWLDLEARIEGVKGTGAPGSLKRALRRARKPEDLRREELLEVQELLRHRMVRTTRRIILLSPEDARKLEALLEAGLLPGKKHRIGSAEVPALSSLDGVVDVAEVLPWLERARQVMATLHSMDDLAFLEVPEGFRATLRGYQNRGHSWLVHRARAGLGACLADDMGLGKTVMSLAMALTLYREARQAGQGWHGLVVAPVSTLPNWEAEARRFAPDLPLAVHAGPGRSMPGEGGHFAHGLVLVSWGTLRQDGGALGRLAWDLVLADEAQMARNPATMTFKALQGLDARARVALTGTPVENSVQDLWAHMEFLNPGFLGSIEEFRMRFGFAIEERRDPDALARLRRLVAPFVLRRRKEDVAPDLPPREEMVLWCDLGPEQRKIYDDIRDAWRLRVDDSVRKSGLERAGLTVLEALLRLRQACLDPGLVNPVWDQAGSAKTVLLLDLVAELRAGGHKVLVFSQFAQALHRLSRALDSEGHAHVLLDGQSVHRGDLVARFQEDPDCGVFLLSLKAGGTGLNLTAADYVVLFDPWWNPAAEAQAMDRAHRIGQERPVTVVRMVARDTVEEKILKLQSGKKELARALVEDDSMPGGRMDAEELRALLD